MIDFQLYFKEWRELRGLSQRQLGLKLGLSKVTISRIETGKRDFTGAFLRDFCIIIDCKIGDPLTRKPDGRPEEWKPDHDREMEMLEGAMAIKKRLRAQELKVLVVPKARKNSARG